MQTNAHLSYFILPSFFPSQRFKVKKHLLYFSVSLNRVCLSLCCWSNRLVISSSPTSHHLNLEYKGENSKRKLAFLLSLVMDTASYSYPAENLWVEAAGKGDSIKCTMHCFISANRPSFFFLGSLSLTPIGPCRIGRPHCDSTHHKIKSWILKSTLL